MSNSPLARYIRWSPNCTKPRQGSIRGVAIHCTAGGRNLPAQRFADMARFVQYNARSGASCHYVVGGDGSIAQVCDEANRAWCTSNPIDHELITIEVASDAANPCEVNLEAMTALIRLLVDICQRNRIPRLLWRGEMALMGQWERQNMVVHRWTANKACPGDYLYGKHGQIAAAVNQRLAAAEAEAAREAEEEDAMNIDEVIEKMTDEQAYILMEKAARHAGTLLEPVWSRTDGYWAAAKARGIMNGEGPERAVKRDELAAVLGRLGLLRAADG